MDDPLLTWYQALQLLAIGPCLFMLFFLCVATRNLSQVFIPILYFLSLASSFLLPLVDVFLPEAHLHGALLLAESLTPALSFLLILQFLTDRLPPLVCWFILAVPLIGGSSLVYATLITRGEVCLYQDICTQPDTFKALYEIFSTSLTFLLTIAVLQRGYGKNEMPSLHHGHKRAMIFALILLNLGLLAIDLGQISGFFLPDRAAFAITVVRIGFIYLVLTSVLRVYDRTFELAYERIPHLRPVGPSERDHAISQQLKDLLGRDKLYRDMELNREALAARAAITEHQLSRVLNQCLDLNFSRFINQYRVEEAKQRLARESTPVTTIAFEVGFNSIPSFNRVFRQMTGTSPSEYRLRAPRA